MAAIRLSHISAGFVAVLVGYVSSAVIVVQAATAAGATPAQVASWLWALGLGMAATSIGLSLYYRAPVLTAWSTAGAALLATALHGVALSDAVGVFIFSSLLLTVFGLLGWVEALLRWIPRTVAAAMLAGVLLRFGLQLFGIVDQALPLLVLMLGVWMLVRLIWPNFAVPASLAAGVLWCAFRGEVDASAICMSPEADPVPERRFRAAVWAGGFYAIAGLLGLTVVTAFAALPASLLAAMAGIALLATLSASLTSALEVPAERDAALLTFLCTASGVTLMGVGSAFWGLVLGVAAAGLARRRG